MHEFLHGLPGGVAAGLDPKAKMLRLLKTPGTIKLARILETRAFV